MTEHHEPPVHVPAPAIAPDERERMVEILTQHYAADRIGDADLEARLEHVYRAATRTELEAALTGLPAPAPTTARQTVPAVAGDAVPVRRIEALLSGQEQRVTGVVPRELRVRSRLGYVELDLTKATFQPGLTTLDLRSFMGYVQVRLPQGVRVESQGHAIAGYFSLRGASRAGGDDAACEVRITGRAVLGYAECLVAKGAPPRSRGGDST
jgi:hypothetical protein